MMIDIRETEEFRAWLEGLLDERVAARIAARIRQLAMGNAGDVRPVGDGVSEPRIHIGPGYRV